MLDLILINDTSINYLPYSYGKTILLSFLSKRGWKVKLIYPSEIYTLGKNPARFFGVGSWSHAFGRVVKTATFLKQRYPEIPIICGGGHVSVVPSDLERHTDIFDYWVLGEGEIAIDEILRGQQPMRTMIHRPLQSTDLVFPSPSHAPILNGLHVTMASRGCPNMCTYCCAPEVFGHKMRYIPANTVLQHIRELLARGATTIQFMDSSFLNNPRWAMEFCDTVIREKLKLNWFGNCCAEQLNEDIIIKLKKSGCISLHFGVESGSPFLLKTMKRGSHLQDTLNAFHLCRKFGIHIHSFVMYGVLGESKESMAATREFYATTKQRSFCLIPYQPCPGTAMFKEAQQKGFLNSFDWSQGIPAKLMFTGFMTRDEVIKEANRLWGNSPVYLGPRASPLGIARNISLLPSILAHLIILKVLTSRLCQHLTNSPGPLALLNDKLQTCRLRWIAHIHCFIYIFIKGKNFPEINPDKKKLRLKK